MKEVIKLSLTRFSPQAVASVTDLPSRQFLIDVGLPAEHLLFTASEPLLRVVAAGDIDRRLLRVGKSGRDEFLVDCSSGEVVYLSDVDSSVMHVNESPKKFLECLQEFMSRFPYGEGNLDIAEREALADQLRVALLKVDDTAFIEDPGFWHSIVDDVAMGDYSSE